MAFDYGADGTVWTILSNGTVGVNGFSDGQSANVVETRVH